MRDLLLTLREKELIAKEQHKILNHNFSGIAKELFEHQIKNTASHHGNRYTTDIKQFAMTMHYYSPKAYEFVRKLLHLPHPSSIRMWAASVNCQPGYLTDVIQLVGKAVQKDNWMVDAVLVVDAMALHKGSFWDPKSRQYVGNIDYGTAIPEAADDPATEALVFMVVGLTGHWKHPIAYVFQDKCSATVQAQLIKDCIGLLHTEGINISSIVFDGTFTNQRTATLLGCKMSVEQMQTWFQHPQVSSSRVHVIFDVCHMLKLMRNMLGDFKTIYTEENGELKEINWHYIQRLNGLQETLGLSLANKLKRKHIVWQKHKMNVKIAAQTLSASVAQAIDFLRDEVQLPEFQGSEATTEFIKRIDVIFDLLNSRNPFAKGTKEPVTRDKLPQWSKQCDEIASYIFNLRNEKGNLLRHGKRKTALWGLTFSIHSIKAIAHHLLTRDVKPFRYVLTYKFSQDSIELLFNKIRRRCGWNNNPNVLQFMYSLRRILIRNSIEPSKTGNCTHFEDALCESTGLLNFTSKRQQHVNNLPQPEHPDADVAMAEQMLILNDINFPNLLRDNVLYYISGFIVRSLLKRLSCASCRNELLLDTNDPHALCMTSYPIAARFTLSKQKGGLIFPSSSVLKIVKATETIFRKRVVGTGVSITTEKNIDLKIQYAVIEQLGTQVFSDSHDHFFDHTIGQECDHLSTLLRIVIKKYLSIRLNTYGKKFNEMVIHQNRPSSRHILTKTILFKHQ